MVLWFDGKFWCRFLLLLLVPTVSVAASSHFDAPPASPLWSFCGTPVPTPVWQCFQLGCRIRFLLPNTETPWQKAEVLALKDHEAMKIDSRNSYQYAPNGLVLVQVRNIVHCGPVNNVRGKDSFERTTAVGAFYLKTSQISIYSFWVALKTTRGFSKDFFPVTP